MKQIITYTTAAIIGLSSYIGSSNLEAKTSYMHETNPIVLNDSKSLSGILFDTSLYDNKNKNLAESDSVYLLCKRKGLWKKVEKSFKDAFKGGHGNSNNSSDKSSDNGCRNESTTIKYKDKNREASYEHRVDCPKSESSRTESKGGSCEPKSGSCDQNKEGTCKKN